MDVDGWIHQHTIQLILIVDRNLILSQVELWVEVVSNLLDINNDVKATLWHQEVIELQVLVRVAELKLVLNTTDQHLALDVLTKGHIKQGTVKERSELDVVVSSDHEVWVVSLDHEVVTGSSVGPDHVVIAEVIWVQTDLAVDRSVGEVKVESHVTLVSEDHLQVLLLGVGGNTDTVGTADDKVRNLVSHIILLLEHDGVLQEVGVLSIDRGENPAVVAHLLGVERADSVGVVLVVKTHVIPEHVVGVELIFILNINVPE